MVTSGAEPVLGVLNRNELSCRLQPPVLCVFLFVLRERETKRIGAILSIHMAGNRKGKKSDLNYEIMLF
jgi:hypothetical protein